MYVYMHVCMYARMYALMHACLISFSSPPDLFNLFFSKQFHIQHILNFSFHNEFLTVERVCQPNQITVSYPNGARRECKVIPRS